jgi:hypothetical protein
MSSKLARYKGTLIMTNDVRKNFLKPISKHFREREREGKKQGKKRKEKKNIIYKLIRLNSNTMVYGCLTFGIRVI